MTLRSPATTRRLLPPGCRRNAARQDNAAGLSISGCVRDTFGNRSGALSLPALARMAGGPVRPRRPLPHRPSSRPHFCLDRNPPCVFQRTEPARSGRDRQRGLRPVDTGLPRGGGCPQRHPGTPPVLFRQLPAHRGCATISRGNCGKRWIRRQGAGSGRENCHLSSRGRPRRAARLARRLRRADHRDIRPGTRKHAASCPGCSRTVTRRPRGRCREYRRRTCRRCVCSEGSHVLGG